MQLIGVLRLGPCLFPDSLDRLRIESTEIVCRGRLEGATGIDRLGSPLFQRGIVEEGVRSSVQDLGAERRRLRQVSGNAVDLAGTKAFENLDQTIEIHRLSKAIGDGL